jgi:hypothetical protein
MHWFYRKLNVSYLGTSLFSEKFASHLDYNLRHWCQLFENSHYFILILSFRRLTDELWRMKILWIDAIKRSMSRTLKIHSSLQILSMNSWTQTFWESGIKSKLSISHSELKSFCIFHFSINQTESDVRSLDFPDSLSLTLSLNSIISSKPSSIIHNQIKSLFLYFFSWLFRVIEHENQIFQMV